MHRRADGRSRNPLGLSSLEAPTSQGDGSDDVPTMADTKAEIAQSAVDAGHFDTLEEAMTWTKAELLGLWE